MGGDRRRAGATSNESSPAIILTLPHKHDCAYCLSAGMGSVSGLVATISPLEFAWISAGFVHLELTWPHNEVNS